jgi:hypothetical protein
MIINNPQWNSPQGKKILKNKFTHSRSFFFKKERNVVLFVPSSVICCACVFLHLVCVAGPKGAKDSLNGRARGASLATKRHLLECINKFDGPTFLLLFLLSIFICKTRPIEIENKNQKSLTCFSPKQHTRRNVRQVFLFVSLLCVCHLLGAETRLLLAQTCMCLFSTLSMLCVCRLDRAFRPQLD